MVNFIFINFFFVNSVLDFKTLVKVLLKKNSLWLINDKFSIYKPCFFFLRNSSFIHHLKYINIFVILYSFFKQ